MSEPNIEFVFYPNRAALVSSIGRFRDDETVLGIDVVANGTTLRLLRLAAPEEDETPSDTPSPSEADEDPKEAHDEDLLGQSPEPVDLSPMSRAQLREFVQSKGLEVSIPEGGPLKDVKAEIATALAEKE